KKRRGDWKYQDDWESSNECESSSNDCCESSDESKDESSNHCESNDNNKKEKKDKKDHPKPPPHHKTCVREVLAAIHEAQKKAKHEETCKTSCDASIKELLGESKKPKKNTIPFMLYCGECAPFKGTGVTTFMHHKQKKFACITSF